ncbi:unnamed protein product [Caenorhabditis angaria]|uniref:Uncharacterized protein n=1 Tax=Caenorhabditis angaria TaxID=860376 RepID=A0A9P1I3M6_9PELO|nr:unnamed protein product [Caenorhabditis angaria]
MAQNNDNTLDDIEEMEQGIAKEEKFVNLMAKLNKTIFEETIAALVHSPDPPTTLMFQSLKLKLSTKEKIVIANRCLILKNISFEECEEMQDEPLAKIFGIFTKILSIDFIKCIVVSDIRVEINRISKFSDLKSDFLKRIRPAHRIEPSETLRLLKGVQTIGDVENIVLELQKLEKPFDKVVADKNYDVETKKTILEKLK